MASLQVCPAQLSVSLLDTAVFFGLRGDRLSDGSGGRQLSAAVSVVRTMAGAACGWTHLNRAG